MTLPSESSDEMLIGLVSAAGTDLERVCENLQQKLADVGYDTQDCVIRLSKLLEDIFEIPNAPAHLRYEVQMDAGNELREGLKRSDAVGMLGLLALRRARETRKAPHAFIIHQLKHPDEIMSLRQIYGSRFIVIAIFDKRELRLQNVAKRIASSEQRFDWTEYRSQAEHILKRDEEDALRKYGPNVRKAFPLADFFVDASDPEELRSSIERTVELLFGHHFHTPTKSEYAMFHAAAAAMRSASLQRQVGAVIVKDGDIISVGTNEVPRPGGGQYWAGDRPDQRDFVTGREISDELRRRAFADILKRVGSAGWLKPEFEALSVDELVARSREIGLTEGARIFELLEFGRCVHAEMAAIVDAARRGVAVSGCSLFSTTFPCHECARHIVAAGVRDVTYIEPYPKSLVSELYLDSIAIDGYATSGQVPFRPFVGVSPGRYMELFAAGKRRDENLGHVIKWDARNAAFKLASQPFALTTALEVGQLSAFSTQLEELLRNYGNRERKVKLKQNVQKAATEPKSLQSPVQ